MTKHFCFDVETLSTESTAIVLSLAVTYFDFEADAETTYDAFVDRALYVKFRMKEQHDMGRATSKDTVAWWMKQGSAIRDLCFVPSKKDLSAVDGLTRLNEYFKEHGSDKSMFWARGSLDQMVLESLCRTVDMKPPVMYNMWMDIRTAIRLTKETSNPGGYCDVPGLDVSKLDKHNPLTDVAIDSMQLVQGI